MLRSEGCHALDLAMAAELVDVVVFGLLLSFLVT
jgi:hypothetical protein